MFWLQNKGPGFSHIKCTKEIRYIYLFLGLKIMVQYFGVADVVHKFTHGLTGCLFLPNCVRPYAANQLNLEHII